MKRTIIFTLTLIFFIFNLRGEEFNFGVELNSYYSNNVFLNSTAIEDYVSVISADVNYTDKNLNFYLDADVNLFRENPDFNSFRVEPGIEYLKYLKGRNYIYFNLGYSFLNYNESFTDFNYNGPFVQFGVKYYLSASMLMKTGYNFQYRDYPNFSSFDFQNHTFFVEINKFFRSQTTIRIQSGLNYRTYPHIASLETDMAGNFIYNDEETNSMNVPNFYSLLRVSQGIGTRLGLFAEAEVRKNFRGMENGDTLINNSYVIYPYNDNYLWDGSRITLGVRFIPFSEISITGKYSYFRKDYPGIMVMNEDGIILDPSLERSDQLSQFSFSLSKKFKSLDLYFNSVFRDNGSNDSFFEYNMLTLSAGVRYYF
ncbi:MAG: hypothetical protein ABFR75_11375 [Acidobacteriota bacterium]